jgi:hypothetical protein
LFKSALVAELIPREVISKLLLSKLWILSVDSLEAIGLELNL